MAMRKTKAFAISVLIGIFLLLQEASAQDGSLALIQTDEQQGITDGQEEAPRFLQDQTVETKTAKPEGAHCRADTDCQSMCCYTGICSLWSSSGICGDDDIEPGLPGDPCFFDTDCRDSACGLRFGNTHAGYICCATGMTTQVGNGDWYCSHRPNGHQCGEYDSLCESGYCDASSGLCSDPPSGGGGSYGDHECLWDEHCALGACGLRFGYEDDGYVCCLSGATVPVPEIGNDYYCSNQPKGRPCASDDMCSSNYCDHVTGLCSQPPAGGPGDSCNWDTDCLSNVCALRIGKESDGYICCYTEAAIHLPGLGNEWYCSNQPNGKVCQGQDAVCKSGYCGDRGRCTDPPLAGPGDKCKLDSQCQNHACGLEPMGYGAGDDGTTRYYTCCLSGETVRIGRDQFCSNHRNGHACEHDATCKSGYCNSRGRCSDPPPPLKGPGESCDVHTECENSSCGYRYNEEYLGSVCCITGSTTRFQGLSYCANRPNGRDCGTSAMCSSGFCDGYSGTCQPPPPPQAGVGEPCDDNDGCKNHACGTHIGSSSGSICCFSGETIILGKVSYCAGQRNGQLCASDGQCASGNCDGGRCRSVPPPPPPPPSGHPGQICDDHEDCRNSACGRTTAFSHKICCFGGETTILGDQCFCAGLGDGERCFSDSMCISQNCNEGYCCPTKDQGGLAGEVCTASDDCHAGLLCGYSTGSFTSFCCPRSNIHILPNGRKLCQDLAPNGHNCRSDGACASGNCERGICEVCHNPAGCHGHY